jgi:hypothetical protein
LPHLVGERAAEVDRVRKVRDGVAGDDPRDAAR